MLTNVFAAASDRPVAENLTLFHDGFVYDFPLASPREATIFDANLKQFTLLDRRRGVQCLVAPHELARLVNAIGQRALNTSNPRIRFMSMPSFQESFSQESHQLTLSAKQLTYVALGQRPDVPSAVTEYRDFADWCARLNTIYNGRPPVARQQLNRALCRRHLVPLQITRHMPGRPTFTSRHTFHWQLEDRDLRRIAMVRQWSRTCQRVSLEQYRAGPADGPTARTRAAAASAPSAAAPPR